MTVGLPVVASCRASIPEVAGEAALYFDPEDPVDIAQSILRMYQDPGIARKLAMAGKNRAKGFSETRQAVETWTILRDVYLKSQAESRRYITRLKESGRECPVLTVILMCEHSPDQRIVRDIRKLMEDGDQAVELIWIVPRESNLQPDELPVPGKLVYHSGDFHTTVLKAVDTASGTFLYFSDGHVVPLSSFVCFLNEKIRSGELNGDFLHGEVYFRDKRSNEMRSSVNFYPLQEEQDRDYCCHYLAFAVRTEATRGVLGRMKSPAGSWSQLAMLLYDSCDRERVFCPVCAKIVRIRPSESPQSAVLLGRTEREFPRSWLMSRILDTPAIRHLALHAFDRYLGLPQWVRDGFRLLLKPFWNRPSLE